MASTQENKPLDNSTMLVPKKLLEHLDVLAAIDRGGSMTKIVYTSKKDCGDNYELNFALFENKRFKNGLLWMKEEALLPPASENKSLRVTGIGADMYRAEIREILGLQIEFVEEFITHTIGLHFLISNFSDEEICHQDDLSKDAFTEFNVEDFEFNEKMLKGIQGKEEQKIEVEAESKRLPALVVTCGSAFQISKLLPNGHAELTGIMMEGGKPFLGLAKILLGTSNYDEIMSLAEQGWRGNTDTQAKYLISESSHYGKFPSELPIFQFGKATDFDLPLSHFEKMDLAHSLVSQWAISLYYHMSLATRIADCRSFYIGGNWVRHWVARRELRRSHFDLPGMPQLVFKFLKTGHTGAIGTMLADPKKTKQYYAEIQ